MPEDGDNVESGSTPQPESIEQIEDTATQVIPTLAGQGASRRNFLKSAVIGSAAIAAAGSAGAAAIGLSGTKHRVIHLFTSQISGPCSGCITGSSTSAANPFTINCNNGQSTPGSFFVWFMAPSLPSGNYTLGLTIDGTPVGPGAAFDYNTGNGDVHQFSTAGGLTCPTITGGQPDKGAAGNGWPAQIGQQDTLDVASFSLPSGGDLMVAVHLKYIGGSIGGDGSSHIFNFEYTLSKVGTAEGCTAIIPVTGQGKGTCSPP